ncbi:unnamed protein product [Caenorhabditis angaria]|uniref:Phosphodiesterase n=1 Tax=Caenorhabditis angaria TaxID=860376 RepID=A0A9P1IIW6_9PELO|nr:unnamed protein product [Caenorhabditis angaria]
MVSSRRNSTTNISSSTPSMSTAQQESGDDKPSTSKMSSEEKVDSPPIWRKFSHPPFNNNRNMQLQLANNRGTKDDWGASLRYAINEEQSTSLGPTVDSAETSSISSDTTVATPVISPSVYERFIVLSDNLTDLVKAVMEEAKKNTDAESCSLFLIDEENNELVANVFDNANEEIKELRVPVGDGVVGCVAKTRTMMNVKDAKKCPFFYAQVDELTGYHTKNILCFPIIDNSGALVGVGELCNKQSENSKGFTRTDEKYAKNFASYCANSIAHCLFYKKIQEASTRSHMATEMMVQGSHLKIAEDDIQRLLKDPLRDWRYFNQNFNDFSFAPRNIGENHFHKASMMFFEDLGFTTRYRINKRKLSYLVLRISAGYRTVPYHNWSHAFAVAHFCWLMMRTEACTNALTDLERLSLIIACLCHDIDHRGTTNSFQLQSKTPLAQLYSSEGSVLERHHYAQTVSILHMPECDILEQLTTLQYRTVLSNIREIILATDIAAHLKKASRIHDMVEIGYNPMSNDHHYLLTCLIMTASDLSDQSKNFNNAKLIAENIYKEFFAQGDLEAEIGVTPLEMMDREKAFVPQVQLEFLDSIGLPVFKMLAEIIPDGKSTYDAIRANQLCWNALKEEIQSSDSGVRQCLTYLKDEDIERKVIEKVRETDPRAAEIASKRFNTITSNGHVPSTSTDIFEGYLEEYQNPIDQICMPNHNNNHEEQPVMRLLPKKNSTKKATEEAALLKQPDCDGLLLNRRARPRRLWRRACQLARSVSESCASCSPMPNRRQISSEDDSESA